MTHGLATPAALPLVYDFEITPTARGGFAWEVFNARTGKVLTRGVHQGEAGAHRDALTAICHLDSTHRYVMRQAGQWALWVGDAEAWVSLPLTPDADREQAREYVAHLPSTGARPVVVSTNSR